MKKLLALLLCAVLFCVPAAAAEEDLSLPAAEAPVRVWGTLTHLDGGGLLVENGSTEDLSSVILRGEDILCLDAVTGEAMDVDDIKDGETVYAWAGPVMTMSLPPQATALLIVANIPADYAAPQYYEIASVTPQAVIAIYPAPPLTQTEVTATDGTVLTITDEASVTARETGETVRLEDLVPGTRMVVWSGGQGQPQRVLVLPYQYSGYLSCDAEGTVLVNGSVLAQKAVSADGTVLLPLRAAAEALGMTVSWDETAGAVVEQADGSRLLSVDPGRGEIVWDGGIATPAVTAIRDGVTYVSASALLSALELFPADAV